MTTIVLADDHHIVRQGLRALLVEQTDFKVVGEAGDGLEAVRLIDRLKPDVLVLDLMMGGMNGLEVARQVTKLSPKTRIVVLSMYGDESYVAEALRVGAKGYILKESSSDELVRAVREVCVGKRYLGPPISEMVIDSYMKKTESTRFDPYDTLTTREREVLHLAAQSATNSEIAEKLFISRRTVEIHRASMMRKLNLQTQTDLIRYAIQRGILPSAPSDRVVS